MSAHRRPESNFDEDLGTWPEQVAYHRGVLDGLIVTLSFLLIIYGVYVVITRWSHLFVPIFDW